MTGLLPSDDRKLSPPTIFVGQLQAPPGGAELRSRRKVDGTPCDLAARLCHRGAEADRRDPGETLMQAMSADQLDEDAGGAGREQQHGIDLSRRQRLDRGRRQRVRGHCPIDCVATQGETRRRQRLGQSSRTCSPLRCSSAPPLGRQCAAIDLARSAAAPPAEITAPHPARRAAAAVASPTANTGSALGPPLRAGTAWALVRTIACTPASSGAAPATGSMARSGSISGVSPRRSSARELQGALARPGDQDPHRPPRSVEEARAGALLSSSPASRPSASASRGAPVRRVRRHALPSGRAIRARRCSPSSDISA